MPDVPFAEMNTLMHIYSLSKTGAVSTYAVIMEKFLRLFLSFQIYCVYQKQANSVCLRKHIK